MKTINWNDGLGPRSRAAWLLLIRGDEITPFKGVNVPQVVVVRGTDYQKAGKWSNTIFRLILADGVREVAGRDGWETGRFAEGLGKAVGRPTPDTWQEVADALGVPRPERTEVSSGLAAEGRRRA